jgi:hypothetical protein
MSSFSKILSADRHALGAAVVLQFMASNPSTPLAFPDQNKQVLWAFVSTRPRNSSVILPAMKMIASVLVLCTSALFLLLVDGCGGGTGKCSLSSISVSPATATADHLAVSPTNSQRFLAFGSGLPSGCVSTQSNLTNVTWSVSDTTNVSISNSQDQTFGAATCLGATSAPVTVTATLAADLHNGQSVSGTATLTCR